jgi:hypothetical protein
MMLSKLFTTSMPTSASHRARASLRAFRSHVKPVGQAEPALPASRSHYSHWLPVSVYGPNASISTP